MKVTLISSTPHAEYVLVAAKNTRLMNSDELLKIQYLTDDELKEQLKYISDTIKSSWEFVDYTFLIEGVSRAFTHQFVRNRTGSYAQQTMRMIDVNGFGYHTGPSILSNTEAMEIYAKTMRCINDAYNELISIGVEIEDARGVLPTNIHTNIVAKFNLRSLSDLTASRSSVRTQEEYRDVLEAMTKEVLEIHPWADDFITGRKFNAAKQIAIMIDESNASNDYKIKLHKALDALR